MSEIVIFVGIPASGKISFCKERFFPSRDADGFWRQFA